jgi:hypothetical protein
MERLNGEIRDRENVMRSLKKDNTPILTGMQILHNHARPHEALDVHIPLELAGIQVEGKDKWLTLIQNAVTHSSRDGRNKKSENWYPCPKS